MVSTAEQRGGNSTGTRAASSTVPTEYTDGTLWSHQSSYPLSVDKGDPYVGKHLYGEIPVRDRSRDDTDSVSSNDSAESHARQSLKTQRSNRQRQRDEFVSRRRKPRERADRSDANVMSTRGSGAVSSGYEERDYVPIYQRQEPSPERQEKKPSRPREARYDALESRARAKVDHVRRADGLPPITIRRGSGRPQDPASRLRYNDRHDLEYSTGRSDSPWRVSPRDDEALFPKMRRAETMPYQPSPRRNQPKPSRDVAFGDYTGLQRGDSEYRRPPPMPRTSSTQYVYEPELNRPSRVSAQRNDYVLPPPVQSEYRRRDRREGIDNWSEWDQAPRTDAEMRAEADLRREFAGNSGLRDNPNRATRQWVAIMPLISNTISQDNTISPEAQQRELLKRVLASS